MDVALPTDVALVDLLPAILRHAGRDLADEGVEHEGWVLQRLGKPPFDENRTAAQLGLSDGDTVHLAPRAAALPEIDFDDLVDAIAEQTRYRHGGWTEVSSRSALLTSSGIALLTGLLAVLLPGTHPVARVATAGGAAIVLLLAAAAVARARNDRTTAVVLGVAAAPYGGVAGWFLPVALRVNVDVAAACSAWVVLAVTAIAVIGIGYRSAVLIGLWFATALAVVTTMYDAAARTSTSQAAAIGLVLAVLVLGYVPGTAFRLAGLRLPTLPTGAENLDEDVEPVPYHTVVGASAAAEAYMTALYWAFAPVAVIQIGLLCLVDDWTGPVLAVTVAIVLLLRARHVVRIQQRWALLVPAVVALPGSALVLAMDMPPFARLCWIFGGGLLVAAALVVASRRLVRRRMPPYWGRAVDIAESVTAVALVPLLFAVLDVYGYVRGLAG